MHLGIRDGTEAVHLETIGGEFAPSVWSRIGNRLPLATSTIGKALLSVDPASPADSPEITRVRELRMVAEMDRYAKGFGCVAVPIGRIGRSGSAALSVSGPTSRVRDRRLLSSAQTAAAEILRRIDPVRLGTAGGFTRKHSDGVDPVPL